MDQMNSALVIFVHEKIEGFVPVGSNLGDVLRQFGIRKTGDCDFIKGEHCCVVRISSGSANISPATITEAEHFRSTGRKEGERLACEAKILTAGEIAIMTEPEKKETKAKNDRDPFVESFEALPLEKKLSSLLRLEAVALGETLEFVINSPLKIFEKIGDVMAEFGMKLEAEAKKANQPGAAATAAEPTNEKRTAARPKRSSTTAPKRKAPRS